MAVPDLAEPGVGKAGDTIRMPVHAGNSIQNGTYPHWDSSRDCRKRSKALTDGVVLSRPADFFEMMPCVKTALVFRQSPHRTSAFGG